MGPLYDAGPIAAKGHGAGKPICWSASCCRPAADTTVLTLANTIRAFCEFPDSISDEWRSDRGLLKARRSRKVLPLGFTFPLWPERIAMNGGGNRRLRGYRRAKRCGLMFAAANRDPRRWGGAGSLRRAPQHTAII